MDRFLRILFALLVVIGATGAELRLPQESVAAEMDCPVSADGTCPCGMPMPEPRPCTSIPSPVAPPSRTVSVVVAQAAAADPVPVEPKPWPRTWESDWSEPALVRMSAEPIPCDTGPPLLASERSAHLGVFRI